MPDSQKLDVRKIRLGLGLITIVFAVSVIGAIVAGSVVARALCTGVAVLTLVRVVRLVIGLRRNG